MEEIAATLRHAIDHGDYPPGTLIPTETELMAAHGTGRETIRRAVAQLTTEGSWNSPPPAPPSGPTRRASAYPDPHRLPRRDRLLLRQDRPAMAGAAPRRHHARPRPVRHRRATRHRPRRARRHPRPPHGDPATGQPTQLATYIPASLAAEIPVLAQPDTGPGGIYDRWKMPGTARSDGTKPSPPACRTPPKPGSSASLPASRSCGSSASPRTPRAAPWRSTTPGSAPSDGKQA